MAAGTLALFLWELDQGASLTRAQTVALTTMVVFQMFHVGNCRSEYVSVFRRSPFSNPFLFIATAAALLIHVAALYLGPTQVLLRVEPIGEIDQQCARLAAAESDSRDVEFAERRSCRWAKILDYFQSDERETDPCGHCDNCLAARS